MQKKIIYLIAAFMLLTGNAMAQKIDTNHYKVCSVTPLPDKYQTYKIDIKFEAIQDIHRRVELFLNGDRIKFENEVDYKLCAYYDNPVFRGSFIGKLKDGINIIKIYVSTNNQIVSDVAMYIKYTKSKRDGFFDQTYEKGDRDIFCITTINGKRKYGIQEFNPLSGKKKTIIKPKYIDISLPFSGEDQIASRGDVRETPGHYRPLLFIWRKGTLLSTGPGMCYIDQKGNEYTDINYFFPFEFKTLPDTMWTIICRTPHKSFIPVREHDKGKYKTGIRDINRKEIIPIEYDSIRMDINKKQLYAYKKNTIDIYDFTGKGNSIPQQSKIQIDWLNHKNTTTTQEYTVEIAAKSEKRIESVKVYLNNDLSRSLSAIPDDGYSFQKTYTVSLKEGANTIRVEVSNTDETVVDEKIVTYKKPQVTSTQDKRIALVVGNNSYGQGNDLSNPINDAQAIASKLESLGFKVILSKNQTKQQMEATLLSFSKQAKGYNAALFYYAGHGMAIDNTNYIIPAGTNMTDETATKYNAVEVKMVLDRLNESGCPVKIMVLDACRDNPFKTRGGSEGFASMEPEGTIIFFSTGTGKKASDGTAKDGHSPFATAFLNALDKPNLTEDSFLKEVTTNVKNSTNNRQFPYRTSGFTGTFIFNKR